MGWKKYPKEKPRKNGKYLCTAKDIYGNNTVNVFEYGTVYLDEGFKSGWYDYDSEIGQIEEDGVIAWMEIPEAYNPKADDLFIENGWDKFNEDIHEVEYWSKGNNESNVTITIHKPTKSITISLIKEGKKDLWATFSEEIINAISKKIKEIKEEEK